MYIRKQINLLKERLKSDRKRVQILSGPRQVGKTTLITQTLDSLGYPGFYASADPASGNAVLWIEQQWEKARISYNSLNAKERLEKGYIVVLDEIQKVPDWSRKIKTLWDDDSRENRNIKVVLLCSSSLLMQQGLTESLAGRSDYSFNSLVLPRNAGGFRFYIAGIYLFWRLSGICFYSRRRNAVETVCPGFTYRNNRF